MKKVLWLFVLALFAVPQGALAQQQWSVGYWTPWGNPGIPPSAIEWGGLTHVVHAWALVRPDGSLDLDTQRVAADAPVLINYAHSKGVKAILGIGQAYWWGQATNLQQALTQNRSILVDNIMNVVNSYGFDGVDVDWEPFDSLVNGPSMQAFAADLRARLGTAKTLSAAAIVADYTYWGKVHGYFDRIGVMTYDLAGVTDPYTWHNAALYDADSRVWSIDLAVKRFTASGVPAAKLAVGIPFFGYKWTGVGILGPGLAWLQPPTTQQISYQSLAGTINAQNYRWDAGARVPFLSVDGVWTDDFYSYDNELSVAEKVRYAETHGLGGWIIWELSGNYFPAQTPNQPLLTAIKNAKSAPATTMTTLTTAPVVETRQSTTAAAPINPAPVNPSPIQAALGIPTSTASAASVSGPAPAPAPGPAPAPASGFPFIPENHIPEQNRAGEKIQVVHAEFNAKAYAGTLTADYVAEKAALVRGIAAQFVVYVQRIGTSRATQGGKDIATFAELIARGFESYRPA